MVAFTSSPTPKVKTRVLALFFALKFLRIFSGDCSPIVGWPSVKKTTVNERDSSLERILTAASSASSMAVPPVASSSSTHLLAEVKLLRCSHPPACRDTG